MQWFRKYRFYPILLVCLCVVGALGFTTLNPVMSSMGSDGPNGVASSETWHKITFAGSTGCVDEADADEVIFTGGRAKVPNNISECTVTLRYSVPFNTSGWDYNIDGVWIGIRYKDNGSRAQVIAKLKRYNIDTGAITTLLVFNSNDFPQRNNFRTEWVDNTGEGLATIDNDDAYYLEVTMKKTARTGKPEVAILNAWVRQE